MLATIFSALGGQIVDRFFGEATTLFKAYFDKQITEAELRAKLLQLLISAVADIEKAHADTLAKTYASFMDTVQKSRLMQAVWASVVLSQLFVLFWYQWAVPAIVTWKWFGVTKFASAGATVEWAYLLLAACLGMGPVVLRNGPGAGNIAATLKSVIGK